ncbi:cytochrome c peroxidase [Arcicella aurantiaca]|uniref:Cytochrome c peroxidase n=1 Tax=Arcicella aurantiaca TaxID=591202 RepID=A0A316DVB0_9BACT|nr:cytochrome c peroxidase [Arcicella aurantiaca]PWK21905.1 cytochrome c peroxidase [Arcicella aurantiaca]
MRIRVLSFTICFIVFICVAFVPKDENSLEYFVGDKISKFEASLNTLSTTITNSDLKNPKHRQEIIARIHQSRLLLKSFDFILRYLEPTQYKKINGPLPIEWETEVFEKFEKPYKREGFGLTIAEISINEEETNKDSLLHLIHQAKIGISYFRSDSLQAKLKTSNTYLLANRLFLLNLSAIYTTGFECPDSQQILPELSQMLKSQRDFYTIYNKQFPNNRFPDNYLNLFEQTILFIEKSKDDYSSFSHFRFIRDYVNPLFSLNQRLLNTYHIRSESFNDYSLNKNSKSIFDKTLYFGQNTKGVYGFIEDKYQLEEIKQVGKMLFYDPILSGNNKRSCASCHKPTQFFTDTLHTTSPDFDNTKVLPRNTPSLLNVVFNHLIMLDGKHTSLQAQAEDVIKNPSEMAGDEKIILDKILSCEKYKHIFEKYLKYTPQFDEITIEHITSAITLYYREFSYFVSPFDKAMNKMITLNRKAEKGFNLFMSKAQCGTCHFVPQFNGVKPPYVGSEFEVIGVPNNPNYNQLSPDLGRFGINPAKETKNAFRTTTIRNSAHTMPYMHNGVFKTIDEVIDFYDNGGGLGRNLNVGNQTLSSDSLHLTINEKQELKAFIYSLNETIPKQKAPLSLPISKDNLLNKRKIGGEY